MTVWASQEFLDGGSVAFKANVNKMVLIKAYTANDTYSTVYTTNKVAEVDVATGDFGVAGASGSPRVMTTTAKTNVSASAGSGTSPDLHVAFVDTTNSKVYWVTNETSNQEVQSGNNVNFPVLTYTFNQPTAS